MLTDNQKHLVIETIKQSTNPSELEKDILDIIEELSKQDFDWNSVQTRISYNYGKYNDLYVKVTALPTTVQKSPHQINEIDLRYILQIQLEFLIEKEFKKINNIV